MISTEGGAYCWLRSLVFMGLVLLVRCYYRVTLRTLVCEQTFKVEVAWDDHIHRCIRCLYFTVPVLVP